MRPQRPRRSSAGSRPRRPRASVARLWASKTAQLVVEEVDGVDAPGESQQRRSVDAYCCDWLRNHSFSGHFRAFGLQNSSVVSGPATRTRPRGSPTHTAGPPNFGTAGAASSGRTSPFGRSSGTRPRPRNRVPKIARSTPGVSVHAINTIIPMQWRRRCRNVAQNHDFQRPKPRRPRRAPRRHRPLASHTPRREEKIGARRHMDHRSWNSNPPWPRSTIPDREGVLQMYSRCHRPVQNRLAISLSPWRELRSDRGSAAGARGVVVWLLSLILLAASATT